MCIACVEAHDGEREREHWCDGVLVARESHSTALHN